MMILSLPFIPSQVSSSSLLMVKLRNSFWNCPVGYRYVGCHVVHVI
uniref:Uncharacterized protein n=1 Tax=Parascaris equorum TaxID=6256 RepID=A0A914RMN6_PAREQ